MNAKKILLMLLSAALIITSASCGRKEVTSDPTSTGGETTGQTQETGETTGETTSLTQENSTVSGGDSTTKAGKTTKATTKRREPTITTKVVVNEEDNKVYPNFGGATITYAAYSKRPELTGDTRSDAQYYALQWAEKKYNCKVVYKVYDSSKMDEAFTAAALSNSFFADMVIGNCIGYVGWCQAGMLEPTDAYYEGRADKERWNLEISRFQETHYGVDPYVSSIVWPDFMVYNVAMLKDLGLTDPKELAKAPDSGILIPSAAIAKRPPTNPRAPMASPALALTTFCSAARISRRWSRALKTGKPGITTDIPTRNPALMTSRSKS